MKTDLGICQNMLWLLRTETIVFAAVASALTTSAAVRRASTDLATLSYRFVRNHGAIWFNR